MHDIGRNTPHQLRAPPADFTGRGAEVAELLDKLGHGGITISSLAGQGGIGKTVLALRVAEKLAPNYPDGQIALNLQGVALGRQEPLSPAAAMMHVIRAFEPLAKRPDSHTELAGQYRSVLHGKRVLLLFDNARDSAQVEPLLPPSECIVIITSRQRFTLPGLYRMDLDVLASDDAVSLVKKIAPRLASPMARAISRLCGNLPLALRSAASTLAEEDDLDPRAYLKQLRTARGRLELVEASLSVSLEQLDPPSRVLWTRLGIFPGDFTAEAAAEVCAAPIGEIDGPLRKLRRHNLLEYSAESMCYRMHDLARVLAVSRLGDNERYTAERRHAEYFLHFASSRRDEYYIPKLHIPWANHLLDIVRVGLGNAVLSVACGPGILASLAAVRTGVTGRVTGVDISPSRIAEARAMPVPAGAASTEFLESPAAPLPFKDASYDIVVCHQGLQFLPDRAGALAEMHRVLRPGGRLGATIWATPEDSNYFAAIINAMRETLPPRVLSLADALFSWTDLASIREAVESAGFLCFQVDQHKLPIVFEGGPDQVLRSLHTLAFGYELDRLPSETLVAFRRALHKTLSPLAPDGVVSGYTTANVITATR